MADFQHALEEVKPAFGTATETLELYRVHGIISCGDAFDHIMQTLRTLVRQVQHRWGAAVHDYVHPVLLCAG